VVVRVGLASCGVSSACGVKVKGQSNMQMFLVGLGISLRAKVVVSLKRWTGRGKWNEKITYQDWLAFYSPLCERGVQS
jgi:hypothetical protein